MVHAQVTELHQISECGWYGTDQPIGLQSQGSEIDQISQRGRFGRRQCLMMRPLFIFLFEMRKVGRHDGLAVS